MEATWLAVLGGGLGVALLGLLGQQLDRWWNRRRAAVDTKVAGVDYSVKLTQRYDALVDQLSEQVAALTLQQKDRDKERLEYEKRIGALEATTRSLEAEVRDLRTRLAEAQRTIISLRAKYGLAE
jgi:chromosome segregation ATPase